MKTDLVTCRRAPPDGPMHRLVAAEILQPGSPSSVRLCHRLDTGMAGTTMLWPGGGANRTIGAITLGLPYRPRVAQRHQMADATRVTEPPAKGAR